MIIELSLAIVGTYAYNYLNTLDERKLKHKFTSIMESIGIQNKKEESFRIYKTIPTSYGYVCYVNIPNGLSVEHLNSPDIILNNALDTWNEIIDNKGINGIMFIDNSSNIIKTKNIQESERETTINKNFIELFDSIFDIPSNNSIKFDNGNLGNMLKDTGCLYIYDIPDDCTSIEVAMSKSEANSVLAKMYKEDNLIVDSNKINDNDNKDNYIECGYLGISFSNQTYNKDYFYQKFSFREEEYDGINSDKNLLLISGCKPPINSMKLIQHEIKDRKKNEQTQTDTNNSSFKINNESKEYTSSNNNTKESSNTSNNTANNNSNLVKKAMKKNLFRKKR